MRRWLLASFLGGLVLVGCGSPSEDSSVAFKDKIERGQIAGATMMAATMPEARTASMPTIPVMPRKVIYTADVTLDTDSLDQAADQLSHRVKQFNAYVGDSSRSGQKGSERVGIWTIRVPSSEYDAFMKSLTAIGELESMNQKANDVSEEYYDVQARLASKTLEEGRLRDLLKTHSGTLTNLLTVEKELARIREEIESVQGRLRYLNSQVDYSTVTVTVREVKNFKPVSAPTTSTRIQRTFTSSVDGLKEFSVGLLLTAVAAIPWVALPAVLIAIAIFVTRRNNRRRAHLHTAP